MSQHCMCMYFFVWLEFDEMIYIGMVYRWQLSTCRSALLRSGVTLPLFIIRRRLSGKLLIATRSPGHQPPSETQQYVACKTVHVYLLSTTIIIIIISLYWKWSWHSQLVKMKYCRTALCNRTQAFGMQDFSTTKHNCAVVHSSVSCQWQKCYNVCKDVN